MTDLLSPQDAARAVAEASRYVDALQERTAGVTWMVWGIVTPAIFLTYSALGALGVRGWWLGFLWMPWVAMGIVTTVFIWRSVAIVVPAMHEAPTASFWLRFFGYTATLTLLMFLVDSGPEMPLMIVGGTWIGMGVLNLWNASQFGRIVAAAAGAPLVVAGLVLAILDTPNAVSALVGLVVSGVSPFVAGVVQTLRR